MTIRRNKFFKVLEVKVIKSTVSYNNLFVPLLFYYSILDTHHSVEFHGLLPPKKCFEIIEKTTA